MRVSVVITNYDGERFLPQAIESALDQTHPDVEVIVVDDGSTDDSASVIRRYDGRVMALMKDHAGQGAAVNAGFAASTGDAVIFLDPDDILLPSAAAEAARLLAEPGVAKVHWPMLLADEKGHPTGEIYPAQPLDAGNLRERLWTCPRYTTAPQSGNAYPRWCLQEILPMPPEPFPAGADCYLYQLVIPFGEVRVAPAALSIYRKHPGSVSAQPRDERIVRWARLDDAAWEALAATCERTGVPAASPNEWRRNSWNHRLVEAVRDIDEHIPGDEEFLLIDDSGSFAIEPDDGRRPVQWWGVPGDGKDACTTLDDHRKTGVRFAVIGWPAFWWLAYYREMQEHLAHFPIMCANERVRIYDLRDKGKPRAIATACSASSAQCAVPASLVRVS